MSNSPFEWKETNSGTKQTWYRGMLIEQCPNSTLTANGKPVQTESAAVAVINKMRGKF